MDFCESTKNTCLDSSLALAVKALILSCKCAYELHTPDSYTVDDTHAGY